MESSGASDGFFVRVGGRGSSNSLEVDVYRLVEDRRMCLLVFRLLVPWKREYSILQRVRETLA